MQDQPDPLIVDLVTWVAQQPRAYREVMDAWRTSCPRLTVFEDAVDQGLIRRRVDRQNAVWIEATDAGQALSAEATAAERRRSQTV